MVSRSSPAVCTIAGSDCSASAGIQADLKTFCALGIYGTTVITAVTAQNSCHLDALNIVPAVWVEQQLQAITTDIPIHAFKIGMLGSPETAQTVATFLRNYKQSYPDIKIIIDPVLRSSSGSHLTNAASLSLADPLTLHFSGIADLITPNLDEATKLSGNRQNARFQQEMEEQAQKLYQTYQAAILLKGGHLKGRQAMDIFWDGKTMRSYSSLRITTPNSRGTGCTLASAITAFMAKGEELPTAISMAKEFISLTLHQGKSLKLGQCGGPLGHFPYQE